MEMEERIKKDIELFEKNIDRIKNKRIKDMAYRYYEDAKYYLEKGDYFTSFGCINYAHGLIDAILNRKSKVIEVIGSAGCGKTSIIEKLLDGLRYDYEIAVIIANFVGDEDGKRIEKHGIKSIVINTGNKCMDAELFENAMEEMKDEMDLIFVENVDITCPYILEDSKKIMILDSTQGKNIVNKFPLAVQMADIIVINKIDLVDGKDMEQEIKKLTSRDILYVSCKTGEGIKQLTEWIRKLF